MTLLLSKKIKVVERYVKILPLHKLQLQFRGITFFSQKLDCCSQYDPRMTASSQLPEGPKTPSHQHPSKIIFASQTLKVGFEMAANLIVAASAEMELVLD